jgi:hypothetical protein
MVDLTVALPMYRSGKIGWLSLESLCRQEQVDFNWELIIAEEQTPPFMGEIINTYWDRLNAVGCERIAYFPLREWIPLSQKWRLIGQKADKASKIFVCQADDDFTHPLRLRESYDRIDYDYICYPHRFFYFINTDEVLLHTIKKYKPNAVAKGSQYSFKTEFARTLPFSNKAKIVDQWLYDIISRQAGKNFKHIWIEGDSWKKGFHTHGFHRLSDKRYFKHKNKVRLYDQDWPEDIMNRLRDLSESAKL